MSQVLTRPSAVRGSLGSPLPRLGHVDTVALEERAAALAALAVEGRTRLRALELAVRVLELTALEPSVTPGRGWDVCAQAVRPGPASSVAAVCVRADLVPLCRSRLEGTGVRVASVVTPAEARHTVELGADEVEVEIDVGALLAGRLATALDEIAWARDAAREADLTVIVQTQGLGTYEDIRRASLLAAAAGADFVELSPASPAAALCALEAIRDTLEQTGRVVGFKAAQDPDSAEQAIRHLVLVHETLGPAWLSPDRYRLAAPSLLDDLLLEIRTQRADAAYDLRHD